MDKIIRSMFIIFILYFMQALCVENNASHIQDHGVNAAASLGDSRYHSSSVWYNIGNCAYNIGDYSYALSCWLKAISGSTYQEYRDIRHNIDALKHKFEQEFGRHPRVLYQGWYAYLFKSVPWIMLQLFFLLFWFCFVCALIYDKTRYYYRIGFLGLGAIMFVMLNKYWIEQQKYGVIKNNETQIFVGPDNHFCLQGLLNQTDCVRIIKEKEGWVAVQAHGMQGWIEAGKIHRV